MYPIESYTVQGVENTGFYHFVEVSGKIKIMHGKSNINYIA